MAAPRGNGDTAEKLAATREDLARLEGVVITELRGLKSDMIGVERGLIGLDTRLQGVEQRFVARDAERAAVAQHQAQTGRRWDRWREWLAYAISIVAVAWNIWSSRR